MDQNKFINTYIDVIMNNLIEQIKTNLQLQTQVQVNEFMVAEKDKIIADINRKLEENLVAADWKVKYEAAESNYNSILGKVRHMDVLLGQVSEMKSTILSKDEKIAELTQEIEDLKSPKKVINTKKKKEEPEPSPIQKEKTEKHLDDF